MKLKNFPPVYYISLEESKDRQDNLEKEFKENNITNYTPMIFKRFAECNDLIHGPHVNELTSSNKGASTSHLKAIKKWLSETNDEYGIFFEDDVSFQTVKYWNFTWEDFINNLPTDCEAVQLMWVRPHMVKVEFRERYTDDWSATAFMLTRKYGQRLIDRFMINDEEFNYDMGNLQPIVENVLFTSGRVYTIPLFVEETTLPTTFINSPEFDSSLLTESQTKGHHESKNSVLNWWKSIGKDTSIQKIMNTEMLPINFSWGNYSFETINSIKRDIGKNNIYEKFYSVKNGDVVVDIGANVGSFSYSIISKNPKLVYCIEPSIELFHSLVENLSKFCAETPLIFINKLISNSFSFQNLIKEYKISNIDLLKIDCDPTEYNILTKENIDWILENTKNITVKFHLNNEGYKTLFKEFRDNFLEKFKDYVIFSDGHQNVINGFELNLTRWIFDDKFLDEYYGELIIYLKTNDRI